MCEFKAMESRIWKAKNLERRKELKRVHRAEKKERNQVEERKTKFALLSFLTCALTRAKSADFLSAKRNE